MLITPQPTSRFLAYDNLDDRREVHRMLAALPPLRRVAFLRWACDQAALPASNGLRPIVQPSTLQLAQEARWDDAADARLTNEIYMDVWQLSSSWSFSIDAAVTKLAEMVRTN